MAKYATYGRTESGDDLQVIVWDHVPTDEEVNKIYKEWYPEEYEYVGFVGWQLMVVKEID